MQLILPSNTTPVPAGYNMFDDGDNTYWFHHIPSFPGAEPLLYKDIISKANSSIEIWDPYFNKNKDHVVFDSVNNNVAIKILTSKGLSGHHANYMTEVFNDVYTLIPASKNVSFCIGVINLSDSVKKSWDFHDRFLIIDNTEAYLIGASVEHNYKSKLSSGIYKISNANTISFIISQFNNHWAQTVKLPSTLQLLHQ